MAKLFLTDRLSDEDLKRVVDRFNPEMEICSLRAHLLMRRVLTDFDGNIETFFSQFDLSIGRFTLMFLLEEAPNGMMPSELAHKVGVTQATISGLINSLEKAQLVVRETHEKDGRAFVIKLTEKGHATVGSIAPDYYRRINKFWVQFQPEERKQLIGLMERMVTAIPVLGVK